MRADGSWGPQGNPKRIRTGGYTYRDYKIQNISKYRWSVTNPVGELIAQNQRSVNYAAVLIDEIEAGRRILTPITKETEQ